MESDLSLIEICGEDDSLLQQITNDDVSSLNKTYFSCSPLQIPRSIPPTTPSLLSHMECMKGDEDSGKPSASVHRDSANKENIYMNKPEMPKLNMEPQQMKRKKKGGGYNLRKSLAWDRAFFTEEGVLNSIELSMISGNFGKSGGEMLPIIHEEGRESLSGVVDCASDSADMQALEGKLFMEMSTSSVNGDRKIGGTSLPKHDSPARNNATPSSTAKRKVLAAHDLNRSGSKRSGCPRPVASSSLKRPAIINTTKAANKETKVSKIPVSKPDPSVLSTTAKSAMPSASQSKRNQIAQPAVNVQKKVGLKGSSNNIKIARNDTNSGAVCKPFAKSTVQQARRNVVRSASEIHSSTNLQTKTNNGLKGNPDPVFPAPGRALNGHKGGSSKIAVTLPKTASSICANMQNVPLQTPKPSGLRMPSPSLGFFGQSKVSASHSLLPKSSQPCKLSKSSIPDVRKPGALNPMHEKPPHAPGKIPEVVNDVTRSGNTRVAGSSMGCSILSTFNSSSQGKMKSDLHVNNMQKVEVKLPYSPNSCEMINNQLTLRSMCNDFGQQSSERAEPCKSEKISHVNDKESQSNDRNLLLQSGPSEHLKKDVDNERAANVCPKGRDLIGTEVQNPHFTSYLGQITQVKSVSGSNDMVENRHGVFSKPKDMVENQYSTQGMSNVHDNWLSNAHDVNEQAGLMKPHNCEDWFPNKKSRRLCINDGTLFKESGSSEEFQECTSLKITDVSPIVLHYSATELQKSYGLSHLKDIEQAKDNAAGIDDFSRKSQAGEMHLLSLDGNLSAKSGKSILSSSAVDNHQQTELQNSCLVADQVFQDNYESQSNDCLLHGECFSSKESQQQNVLQSSKSVVPEKTDACGSELESSSALCLIPPATQDCGSDVAEMVLCLHVKDALPGSVDCESHQENVLLSSKSVVPEKADACGSELESSSALCLIPPATQDCGSDVAEMVLCLPVKDALSGSIDSESHQENVLQSSESVVPEKTDACGSELESSSALRLILPSMQDYGSDVAEMVECIYVKNSLSGFADSEKRVEKYNYVVNMHDTELHSQATSWESERMDEDQITGAVTECNIEAINVCRSSGDFRGSESEIPHCISQLSPAVQVKGGFGISDMIEHKDVEDKQYDSHSAVSDLQSGDDISYCQQGASAAGNDWLSGTRDVNKDSMEHTKLTNSSSFEADKASREENWSPEAYHGLLFEESKSFEESGKFNAGNTADVNSKVKGSCGNGLQSPHGLSEHELAEEANEVAGANNMIKTSLVEDAKMQSLDGSLLVDSCNLNTSEANDKSSVVVNDENEQLVEDANMQSLDGGLLVDSCNLNTSVANDKYSVIVNDENEQLVEDANMQSLDGSLLVDSCNLNTSVANDKSLVVVNDENEQLVDMQSLDGSLLVDSCNLNISVTNDKSSVVVNDENKQPGEHPELQNPGLLVEQVFFDNQKSGLDEELLLASNISSEDSRDGNVLGSVCEPRSSVVCTELAPENQDGVSDVDRKAYLPVEDPISGSVEIEPSVENLKCHLDMKFRHGDELDGQATSLEFNLSSMREDQTSGAVSTGNYKAVGSMNKESGPMINQTSSSGSALQGIGSNVLESVILSEEAETNIFQSSGSPNSELQHESAKQMDATVQLNKSDNDKKQKTLVIKPPPHAVPFSEEWLAALEAAGEEILTRKSGAVQHSPPDKSLPEPSPWSPVKRKNNQGIGPFDCTKFTNTNIPPSSSS